MVDVDPVIDLMAFHAEITPKISGYYMGPDALPFGGVVECLVDPPVEAEGGYTDLGPEG